MKRSRSLHFGFAGSWFITSIKSVTTISAAESDPPGWPDFASVIIWITSRRICLVMAASSAGLLVFCITFFMVHHGTLMRMRTAKSIDQLAEMKTQFGSGAAAHTAALLEKSQRTRLREPSDLIRLHEAVLFLRAYPQSARVMRLADEILFSFAERLPANHDAFADPDISGIVGTVISTNFSYPFVRSLLTRHRAAVTI